MSDDLDPFYAQCSFVDHGALCATMVEAGWTSATVVHLGGNVEGVLVSIPPYDLLRAPALHLLVTMDAGPAEGFAMVGAYWAEDLSGGPVAEVEGVEHLQDLIRACHALAGIQVGDWSALPPVETA